MRGAICALLCGLALTGAPDGALSTAHAHPGDHGPADKGGSDVPQIAFEEYRLDNGMQVILHQDKNLPLVAVDVWYHVGSGNEVPGKSGFAHLFEHMMFQGSKHVGSDKHFEILRTIGASGINGSTNPNRTNYYEVVPSNQLETALWMESDRMGYMLDLLDKEALLNQIDVVRNERRQRYDNVAFGKDRFAVAAALYPEGHPYRYLTIGRHEDLEAASLEDVIAFFKYWYVPSNATLVLAGDFEIGSAKDAVDKWFGTFPTFAAPEPTQPPPVPVLMQNVRQEIEDEFARYPRIHYVWHSPKAFGDGDAELDILADVLGSGGWGRLHKLLVVDKQVAQSARVYQSSNGFSGEFHVVVNAKPGQDLAAIENMVQTELDRAAAEPISAAELARSVNGIEASFVWGLESLMSRAERLQYFNHFTGDPGYANRYLQTYRSRTPQGILATATKVLSKKRVEIITHPAKKAAKKAAKKPGNGTGKKNATAEKGGSK